MDWRIVFYPEPEANTIVYFDPDGNLYLRLRKMSRVRLSTKRKKDVVLDCELDPRSGKPDDYTIGNCCFSVMHQSSRSKRKTRNQDNVSECRDISTHGQSFQVANTLNI